MTLRLVITNDQPDKTPYCQQIPCHTNRELGGQSRKAVILLGKWGNPGKPSCEECARWEYEKTTDPSQITLTPLADYAGVDWFEEAREAALATPEQVVTTGAAQAPREQPATAPVGNGFTAEERAARAARRSTAQHMPGSSRPWGIAAITSLVLGFVLCLAGLPDGTQIGSEPSGGLIASGILLILTSAVAGIICAVRYTHVNAGRIQAQRAAAPAQVSSYQQGIPVSQLATAAVIGGAAIALHHHNKQQQARLRDSALGIGSLNAAHDGMRRSYARQTGQQDERWQQYVLAELRKQNQGWF